MGKYKNALMCASAMVIGQFLLEYFITKNYSLALDRSYFQTLAIFTYVFIWEKD